MAGFCSEYNLRGFCLVGSMPLLSQAIINKHENELFTSDMDIVLLADTYDATHSVSPLPQLAKTLQDCSRLRDCIVWYVHALVPIVKVQFEQQSIGQNSTFVLGSVLKQIFHGLMGVGLPIKMKTLDFDNTQSTILTFQVVYYLLINNLMGTSTKMPSV